MVLLLIFCASACFANDRVIVQHQFKKVLWTCPVCRVEEPEDRPMEGGASYEHTCKNGHKYNQSGPNMWECNGSINYSMNDYIQITQNDIDAKKQAYFDEQLYTKKHPAPYVEPKISDYENMIADKQRELQELETRKAEAVAKADISK